MQCLKTMTAIQDLLSIRVSTHGIAYPKNGLLKPTATGQVARPFKMRKHLGVHPLAKFR